MTGRSCGEGAVPAADAYKDLRLYNGLIDAFSMRGFVPAEGVTGHDHFFGAFTKFGGTDPSHTGEWLDEVAGRAASQNDAISRTHGHADLESAEHHHQGYEL